MLVDDIGARPPGSPANRRATDHIHASLTTADKPVTTLPFTTRWWEPGTGWLEVDGVRVEVDPNPYSPAGDVQGRAVLAGRLSALEELGPDTDMILVLTDELAREQVLPAAFPFLLLPEHERIRTALHRLSDVAAVPEGRRDVRARRTWSPPGVDDSSVLEMAWPDQWPRSRADLRPYLTRGG